jgi:hypothetical protein
MTTKSDGQTIEVLFPEGLRNVPAQYGEPPAPKDDWFNYLTHKPTLEPCPIEGWSFHRLISGDWIAISGTVAHKLKVQPRLPAGEDDGLDV